jgi:hypothetical protein
MADLATPDDEKYFHGNNWVKTTFDWINRSISYRQILRFSEQKLGNLSRNVAEFRSVEIAVMHVISILRTGGVCWSSCSVD